MKLTLVIVLIVTFFATNASSSSSAADDDDCKDTSDKCVDWEKHGFCENCYYKCDDRKKYCSKTCGFCGDKPVECKDCTPTTVSTTPAPCFDAVDSCKHWKEKGFCSNCFYKCADRVKWCAKTCGFCSSDKCVDCDRTAQFWSLLSVENDGVMTDLVR
ncbi:unnamed protein product [Caenorhabditis sp. 36 PRJEB53466]|nr:unnamed protein product [Caenorhabditis sp. 36 PRJEB53466]